MFELTVESNFSSAHKLRDYEGDCKRLHGHTFKVHLTICGNSLNHQGLLYDFKDMKKYLKSILDELDHNFLNDMDYFTKHNPTSENIAVYIFEKSSVFFGDDNIKVKSVTVFESPTAYVKYSV